MPEDIINVFLLVNTIILIMLIFIQNHLVVNNIFDKHYVNLINMGKMMSMVNIIAITILMMIRSVDSLGSK